MKNLKMFIIFSTLSSCLLASDLANPNQFKSLKQFGPPSPITPNIAQNYGVENQFDRTDRNKYFSVAKKIDESLSPLRLQGGIYGKNYYSSALAMARTANFYAIANLNFTKANGYKDGGGNEVDFGYERFNQALVLGWVPNELNELKFTFLHDNIKDDKQPEYQMDPIKTDRKILKFDGRLGDANLQNTITYGFSYKRLEREVNNFKVRKSPQEMFVELDRDTWDINLAYDSDFGNFHNKLGFIFTHDSQIGKRYRQTPKMTFLNAYRFADLDIHNYRVFDDFTINFNEFHKATLGLSYEYNDAKVKKFNEILPHPQNKNANFPSAKQLWKKYYGINFDGSVDEELFGVALKYEFKPNELQDYKFSVGHIQRLGNNTERFNSLSMINPAGNAQAAAGNGIIGNPYLEKEKHNFIKFNADLKNENFKGYMNSLNPNAFNIGFSLMYDKIDDLIIFDRARKQNGILESSGDIIARNADADIFLAKLYAKYNFNAHFGISSKIYYAYGQNRTDNRALYQIRPFELDLNLDYKDYFSLGSYNLGAGLRAVSKQNRGDFDKQNGLGIDNKDASKGFALLDLYAGINFKDNFGVKFGVNNIFDKHYAEFISADHIEAFSPSVIYARGRTFYLSFNAAF